MIRSNQLVRRADKQSVFGLVRAGLVRRGTVIAPPLDLVRDSITFTVSDLPQGTETGTDARGHLVVSIPAGQTISMTRNVALAVDDQGATINGGQLNPDNGTQGYHSAGAAYSSAVQAADAAITMSGGDIFVQTLGAPVQPAPVRYGLIDPDSVACLYVTNDPIPTGDFLIPSVLNPSDGLEVIDIDAAVAALPALDVTGQSLPDFATMLARAKGVTPFFLTQAASNDTAFFQDMNGTGCGSSGTNDNYGQFLSGTFDALANLLATNTLTAAQKREGVITLAMIGKQIDNYFVSAGAVSPAENGGLYNFHAVPCTYYRSITGKDIEQVKAIYPMNLLQWTDVTPDIIDLLEPHNVDTYPMHSHIRTATAVNGLTKTLAFERPANAQTRSQINLIGMSIKRLSDGQTAEIVSQAATPPSALSSTSIDRNGITEKDVTLAADMTPAFAVGEPYILIPNHPLTTSMWTLADMDVAAKRFEFDMSHAPIYMSNNTELGSVMAMANLGCLPNNLDPMVQTVMMMMTANVPLAGREYPSAAFSVTDADRVTSHDWFTELYNAFGAGLLGSPILPTSVAAQPAVTTNFTVATDTGVAAGVVLTIVAPPDNGGTPILNYEYRFDTGPWTTLKTAAGSYAIAAPAAGTTYNFQLRAVNYYGPSTASVATTVTSGAAASANLLFSDTFIAADYNRTPIGGSFANGRMIWPAAVDQFEANLNTPAARTAVQGSTTYRYELNFAVVTTDGNFRPKIHEYAAGGVANGTTDILDGLVGAAGVKSETFTTKPDTVEIALGFQKISAAGELDIEIADPRLFAV